VQRVQSLYRGELRIQVTIYIKADSGRSEYLNMERQWHDRSPYVNQSLFNPEWIYGVSSTHLGPSPAF
jgi:hypothetical protein